MISVFLGQMCMLQFINLFITGDVFIYIYDYSTAL